MRRRAMCPLRVSVAAAAVIAISLGSGSLLAQEDEKETPPPPGQPKDFRVPEKETYSLDNGLAVTLVPYGAIPKVNVQLAVRAGAIDQGADEVWLSDLTADLLKEGTATRSAEDIAREAAAMGGGLNINAGPDRTTFTGEVLAEFGPDMVGLIADVVRFPLFPESELARLKADRVRQLAIANTQPQAITNAEFRKRMYPDHPYGRLYPDEAMLNAYTVDQARAFYDENFGAARSHLYVSGRFDPDAIKQAIEEAFADWQPGPELLENPPEPTTGSAIYMVDRPDAPQSTIYLGLPVIDPTADDYVALLVTNTLLGGAFSSRITSNIREDKGYTYSPFSQVSTRFKDGYWVQTADVTTEVTGSALKEIFYEINRLQEEPPSEEELRGVQNYLAGIFVLQNSSRGGIIGQLSFLDLHGLSDEYLTGLVNRVYAVTPEEVQRIAQEYLRDEDMLLVITGDRGKIEAEVSEFGEVSLGP